VIQQAERITIFVLLLKFIDGTQAFALLRDTEDQNTIKLNCVKIQLLDH